MNKIQYNKNDEPAVFSKGLSDLILSQENPAELIALYWFYYYTAKWQGTNQPKATNKYAAKALHWSCVRVSKVSKQLSELNLIKRIIAKNKEGKVIGHYVKVCFIWSDKKPDIKETILKENHTMVSFNINALSNNSLNALSNNNKKKNAKRKIRREEFDPSILPAELAKHKSIQKAWEEYIQHRKELKKPFTPLAYKKLINKLLDYDKQTIILAINRSIENDWTGIFPESISTNIKKKSSIISPQKNISLQKEAKCIVTVFNTLRIEASNSDYNQHYQDIKNYWMNLKKKNERIVEHLGLVTFLKNWLEFLKTKQHSFPVRGIYDVKIGGVRWNEFIKKCENWTGYNFQTGRRIE